MLSQFGLLLFVVETFYASTTRHLEVLQVLLLLIPLLLAALAGLRALYRRLEK